MFGKLAKLPLRFAKKMGRKIQASDDAYHADQLKKRGGDTDSSVRKERIPDHELDDLTPDMVVTAESLLEAEVEFLDVRTLKEFREGHIAGAINMHEIDVMIRLAELPPEGRVVAYDESGEGGMRVARFLRRRGFDDLVALEGGLSAWEAAGGQLEAG